MPGCCSSTRARGRWQARCPGCWATRRSGNGWLAAGKTRFGGMGLDHAGDRLVVAVREGFPGGVGAAR